VAFLSDSDKLKSNHYLFISCSVSLPATRFFMPGLDLGGGLPILFSSWRTKERERTVCLAAAFFPFPNERPRKDISRKMIRVFTTLCKLLFENLTDMTIFQNTTDGFKHYGENCPACGAAGKLSPYGIYSRGLVSYVNGKTIDERVNPRRFDCTSCGVTHALLPDILVPYSPYSLHFKLTALSAYYERSTTVVAICEHFGIAVSTLYSWIKLLSEHKELLLGAVASMEESAITFLRSLFEAACLSDCLRSFFRQHAFSFMQRMPATATRSPPP
jgi:transposase-like protein